MRWPATQPRHGIVEQSQRHPPEHVTRDVDALHQRAARRGRNDVNGQRSRARRRSASSRDRGCEDAGDLVVAGPARCPATGSRPRNGCTRQPVAPWSRAVAAPRGRRRRSGSSADLLLGLAQRRREQVGVARLGLAAGQPELAAVEPPSSARITSRTRSIAVGVAEHRHEHGGVAQTVRAVTPPARAGRRRSRAGGSAEPRRRATSTAAGRADAVVVRAIASVYAPVAGTASRSPRRGEGSATSSISTSPDSQCIPATLTVSSAGSSGAGRAAAPCSARRRAAGGDCRTCRRRSATHVRSASRFTAPTRYSVTRPARRAQRPGSSQTSGSGGRPPRTRAGRSRPREPTSSTASGTSSSG